MPGTCSWECHKCKSVNAPHVDRCACSLTVQPYTPVYPSYPGVTTLPGTITVWPPFEIAMPWTIITYSSSLHGPSEVIGEYGSVSDNVARFTQ